jgi:hypothetical protein
MMTVDMAGLTAFIRLIRDSDKLEDFMSIHKESI